MMATVLSAPITNEERELGPYHPITLCAKDDQRDVWTAERTANLGIEGLRYHPDRRLFSYEPQALDMGWDGGR